MSADFRTMAGRLGYRPDIGAIVGALLVLAAFSAVDPSGWWSFFTLKNVTQYTAILGFLVLGQTLVIMTGEIDLSVGSVYGLTAIAFIFFAGRSSVPVAFVGAMAVAGLAGLFNSLMVVRLGLVSMVVTMSTLFIGRGVIYVWTGGSADSLSQADRVYWLTKTLGGSWLWFKNGFFVYLLIVGACQLMLARARLGNHIMAAGGDAVSAHSRGVDVARTKATAFLLSALLAGLSGIVTICDQPQTHVTLGESMEMESIAAAVLGGALLAGGRGSAIGAALGAFIITAVRYELIGLGAPSSWYISFVGLVLVVAVIANQRIGTALRGL